jgi:hypothetical protein
MSGRRTGYMERVVAFDACFFLVSHKTVTLLYKYYE